MMKFTVASLLAVFVATPVFAAAEKPNGNAGKGYHCRKLAYEKYHIQAGVKQGDWACHTTLQATWTVCTLEVKLG